mmetsp:Transcript_85958/g.216327  ORF Transcript_85958/g.216327 Transcript_85958/m.216327 type:complete len:185 (-) Transcript_85958:184-738(-)
MPAKDDYSLGVTALLNELLEKEENEDEPTPEESEAAAAALQRTTTLCKGVSSFLDAHKDSTGDAEHWEALKAEVEAADPNFVLKDTLSSTNGSLAAALRANDAKLQRIKAELQELKMMCADAVDPLADTVRTVSNEDESMIGCDFLDLDKLLSECESIQAETGKWHGSSRLMTTQELVTTQEIG